MKALRRIAAAPFLVAGIAFTLVGVFLAHISFIISDGIDPRRPPENPIDEHQGVCNTSTTAQFGCDAK